MPDSELRLASLVPSLYYDLIARVCAGVPFVGLLLWDSRDSFAGLGSSPLVALLLLTLAGYIAGLILTPVSLVWSLPVARFLRARLRLPPGAAPADYLALYDRTDAVAAKNAEAGATLAKMQAETVLAMNLLTAFLVLVIAERTNIVSIAALGDQSIGFLIVVSIALVLCAWQRQAVFLVRQHHLYQLHVSCLS